MENILPNNNNYYENYNIEKNNINNLDSSRNINNEKKINIFHNNNFVDLNELKSINSEENSSINNEDLLLLHNSTNSKLNNNVNINISKSNNLDVNQYQNCIKKSNDINNLNNYTNDHYNNISKKKYGSLQKFVHNTEVAVNFSCDLFLVEEVHKIALLDLRILNCDRNDENILVVK